MSVSFAGHELHSPRFEDARAIARDRFGIDGAVSELGSHGLQNVLVDTGSARYVLKIANPVFAEAKLDLQNRAMVHLAERMSVGIPLPCPALDGSEIIAVERGGATYLVRLVTFVEGSPLVDTHLSPPILYSLGHIAGELVRALESFEHPAADRVMQWDPRHVGAVVEALAPHIEDPRRHALVLGLAASASEAVERLVPTLPVQIVHCDLTDWNVIGRRDGAGRLMPCGVIDFGDVTRTLRVCELAVIAATAYVLDDPITAAAEIVRGFDDVCPLEDSKTRRPAAPDRGACRCPGRRHGAAGTARAAQRVRPECTGTGTGRSARPRRRCRSRWWTPPSAWPAGAGRTASRRPSPRVSGRSRVSRRARPPTSRRPGSIPSRPG